MSEARAGRGRDGGRWRRLRVGIVALALPAALLVAWRYSACLAPIRALDLPEPSGRLVRFTDRDGHLLASLVAGGDAACQPVPLDQLPDALVHAFIAAEDKRFYRHGGVDYLAMSRAAAMCVWRRRVVSGGSTITMQLARLLNPKARTPLNKLREMHTAWRLEAGMTKGEILDAYLNRVPMGGDLMGVGAASRVFFDREPRDLNLAEAALLAAIPADPGRYDPRHDLERVASGRAARSGARRAYVLEQMAEAGFVTRGEAELAKKSGLEVQSEGNTLAVYQFLFRVLESAPVGATVIRVTLDRETQRMAAEQVRVALGELADHDVTNAAAIVLDNRSGEVLAYVGSASFFDEEHAGQVDGVQAPRQPGSTLKPFVYALALERGFTPATVLPDVPTAYPMAPEQQYEPENYSNEFHGPVLLRSALANSLNVPACHVASQIGVPDVLSQLRRFGFESLDRNADYYGLGVVLGGGEVTLYELARAYMALARDGVVADPVECMGTDGREVPRSGLHTRVCRPVTSYLITDILSDRDARSLAFGRRSPLDLPFTCAAKTGTSSGHRDNWAVGYTRDYTVAVWVGNFDGHPMQGVSGISGAGPLFGRIMYHLYGERAGPPARAVPAELVRRPVCSLSGKRPSRCCPHVREELLPTGSLAEYEGEACDWHRRDGASGQLRTVVPDEFRVDSSGGRP